MKLSLPISLILVFSGTANAQKMTHAFGVNYSMYSGAFGNSDIIAISYAPQLQKIKGKFAYGICSPATMGVVSSSSRERSRAIIVDLPLSAEISFCPNQPCVSYKYFSVFAGAGLSRQINLTNRREETGWVNSYVGVRVPPYNIPLEIRFNYARSIGIYTSNRIGLALLFAL